MGDETQVSLRERVAIVTGASRGVGRACVFALAQAGCHVVLAAKSVRPHDRLPGTIHSVTQEVSERNPGVRALPVACDVRRESDILSVVETTRREFGRIDLLINNAGAAWWFPVSKTPPKRFDLVMNVNFRASHIASQAVIPAMLEGGFGHIVNMSPPIHKASMVVGKVAYMVSKFGMTYLTLGLAEEHRDDPLGFHSLWPVTLIESAATRNLGLGTEADWRQPSILGEATVALCSQDPKNPSGRAWLDEEVLRELRGEKDFSRFSVVPGSSPSPIPW